MLTWAICWMVVRCQGASEGIGVLILMSMMFDLAMVLGGVAIWRYIK